MPINILMPALSPTMEEGTLSKWLLKEGDKVSSGDVMAEIETDKATMEFEAVDEGVLGKIVVPEGTEGVKVNDVIAVLLEEGESADAIGTGPEGGAPAPAKAEAPKPAAPTPPADGGGKADGAADALPAGLKGYGAAEGQPVEPEPDARTADGGGGGARIFASPLARRIATDKGLDLAAVKGTGPHGRIVKADVEAAKPGEAAPATRGDAAAPGTPAAAPVAAPAGAPKGPDAEAIKKMYADRAFEEVKLDGMRRTIATRLTEAKATIPHFYLRRDMTLDALLTFRGQLNKELEGRGVKLSVNDFIIKACALALQAVPDANAVWAGDRVLKLAPSDVAVAVAIEGGLFTPVIRDADKKTLSAISAEMKDLAARARTRKLAPHEYQGGSFAISNLGMMGIDNFDAVINPPHASILAVGAGVRKPVVAGDEIVVATVMSTTLSVDHRVIDGALGAAFLEAVKTNLEHPIGMLA